MSQPTAPITPAEIRDMDHACMLVGAATLRYAKSPDHWGRVVEAVDAWNAGRDHGEVNSRIREFRRGVYLYNAGYVAGLKAGGEA